MSQAIQLYPHNTPAKLDREIFRHPPAEYRGTPFWAWNNRLNQAQLERQISQFKQMGMGGFHIHVRTGLATEYLSAEFLGKLTEGWTNFAPKDGILH